MRPGLRLIIDPRSREPFEWFCFRAAEMTRELDAFVREIPARHRFLDVGACHGIFSLAFAERRPDALALAVEPSTVAYEILAENLRLGGLGNVLLRKVALGASEGTLRMRQVWHHLEAVPDEPSGASGGDGDAGRHGVSGSPGNSGTTGHPDEISVPMRTVDALCAELAFQPDLVKIDVEGCELAVLAGAQEILARHRPRLFLELHPDRLGELGGSTEEVVRLLEGHGYHFYRLGGRPLTGRQVARRRSVCRIICAAAPSPAALQL